MVQIIALIGSALIFYFAFPNIVSLQGFSVGGWFFAIPLLFVLDGASILRRIAAGLFWGLLAYGGLVHWLAPISPGAYLLFVVGLSLQALLFSMIPTARITGIWKLFFYPSVWVLSEVLRASLFGGFFCVSLAYSQAFYPFLIQGASWGGVVLVAWVMMLVNTAVFLWMKGDRRAGMLGLGLFLGYVFAAFLVLGRPADNAKTFSICTVQPNISHEDKMTASLYQENAMRHVRLTRQGLAVTYPDLVVWPETAFPDDLLRDPLWRPALEKMSRDIPSHMLVGSALLQEGKDLNSALLFSPLGRVEEVYHKRHLVPFGEYQPNDVVSQKITGIWSREPPHFYPGSRPGLFSLQYADRGHSYADLFGVAICSEEGYPALFSDLARRGASFFVVMLNDGWFRHPQALMMHAQLGVLRAVETGRPLIRASNTGWSVAFDALGRRMSGHEVNVGEAGFLSVHVSPGHGQTLYVRWGEFFSVVCAGFVIMTLVFVILRRKKEMAHG